jgi:hypothetical protein
MNICTECGRQEDSPLGHAIEYGHAYAPEPACPHGRRIVECDPCSEREFEARIQWDETERTYGR